MVVENISFRLVHSGMTEKQAISPATIDAAQLLGQQERLGQLSVGKQADIISVNDSPRLMI